MAEAATPVVSIDTLAGATVSSDVGEEERSASGPRVLSCQLVIESVYTCHKFAAIAHWARVAAQRGLLSAQPAPAPTPCGL